MNITLTAKTRLDQDVSYSHEFSHDPKYATMSLGNLADYMSSFHADAMIYNETDTELGFIDWDTASITITGLGD